MAHLPPEDRWPALWGALEYRECVDPALARRLTRAVPGGSLPPGSFATFTRGEGELGWVLHRTAGGPDGPQARAFAAGECATGRADDPGYPRLASLREADWAGYQAWLARTDHSPGAAPAPATRARARRPTTHPEEADTDPRHRPWNVDSGP